MVPFLMDDGWQDTGSRRDTGTGAEDADDDKKLANVQRRRRALLCSTCQPLAAAEAG